MIFSISINNVFNKRIYILNLFIQSFNWNGFE